MVLVPVDLVRGLEGGYLIGSGVEGGGRSNLIVG